MADYGIMGGNGSPVDCVLQECAGAVVRGVAQLPHTREQGWYPTNTENYLQINLERKLWKLWKCIDEIGSFDPWKKTCVWNLKSGIKYEKLNDLFPEKSKEHNMKTRNTEKFTINFAITERLKKGI